MVALQFLVLPVQVRILVRQHNIPASTPWAARESGLFSCINPYGNIIRVSLCSGFSIFVASELEIIVYLMSYNGSVKNAEVIEN